ncbi:hypothetical protein [Erythrobacter alti]|uniref:hypothetical protein n=1 Tax=Erythrobacter alti TaxID=1896145 RepID=UPI0030F3B7A2
MTTLAAEERSAPLRAALPAQNSIVWPVAALVVVFALQLHLVFTRSINWDEFHYLALVHELARGELAHPLQSFHARLFAWLPLLELPCVDQVVRGRLVMWLCEIASCAAITVIARRFVTLDRALCCALAYASVIYVMQHGFAFRYDPLAAALCMVSLAILARSRLSLAALAAFAVLMGVAFLVTIKIVLLLPAFAGVTWLRWSDAGFGRATLLRLAAAPVLAALVAGLLYLWHIADIVEPASDSATLNRSSSAMFGFLLTGKLGYLAQAVLAGIPFFLTLALAIRAIARGERFSTAERVVLAGLAAPILWVLFYENTYPYFYTFMLAPVAVALAAGIGPIADRYGSAKFAVFCAAIASVTWAGDGPSRLDTQRDLQATISDMFAEPVNYFDFPDFLPDHRKANFFMTNWGMENYIQRSEPEFRDTMLETEVPLLLTIEEAANPTLFAVMHDLPQSRLFHPADIAALRETYRHVWGPAYLAGTVLEPGETRVWTVFVPGTYTVEGSLEIEGQSYRDGALVTLGRGSVVLIGDDIARSGLLWGDHIQIPAASAPARPYWTGF